MSEVNNKTLQNEMKAIYEAKVEPAVYEYDVDNKGVGINVYRIQRDTSDRGVSIERVITEEESKDAEITVERYDSSSRETWVRVPHKNCMGTSFETQRPEELEAEIEATVDTFTKSEPPFNIDNFGDSSTLLVDGDSELNRETFVRFELPLWFLPVVSIETKMRLYYRGTITEDDSLLIYRNSREWGEYSLTHANAPNKEKFVTKQFEINRDERFIEFDLTELVDDWKLRPEFNFGINISSAEDKRFSFYSRESNKPPILIGTYFDPNIKSLGRATKSTLIEIKQRRDNDSLVTIEPKPYYTTFDKEVILKFYEKGGLIPNDINAKLTVTKPQTNVELGVYELREVENNVIISNIKKNATNTGVQVTVTRKITNVVIDTPNSSDREVNINVQGMTNKIAQLEVVYGSGIDVELDASSGLQKHGKLTVTRKEVGANLFVTESDDKEVTIHPRVNKISEKNIQLATTKRTKSVTIAPRVKYISDAGAELNAKGWEHSNKSSQITVTHTKTLVELTAHKSIEDRKVELYVNDTTDSRVVIEAIASSSKNVALNVVEVDDSEAQITVTKLSTDTQIGVYFEENSEPIVELTPRMRRTSNKEATISVKGENLGYAFIM